MAVDLNERYYYGRIPFAFSVLEGTRMFFKLGYVMLSLAKQGLVRSCKRHHRCLSNSNILTQ